MRYRVFTHKFLHCFADRPAFAESFLGEDPNSPVYGILYIKNHNYVVTTYHEYTNNDKSHENEFHEIESEWFADVNVVRMT